MISPKSVRRRYKKRGLFTIMYHLLGIAKHHLSSTISKSPCHETQALPCNFLTESFILAILGDKSTQANAFYIMSFINIYIGKIILVHCTKLTLSVLLRLK